MVFKRVLLLTGSLLAGLTPAAGQDYCRYVDPLIGSQGLGWVFIGPTCPFGMVKPGPNSGWRPEPTPAIGWGGPI